MNIVSRDKDNNNNNNFIYKPFSSQCASGIAWSFTMIKTLLKTSDEWNASSSSDIKWSNAKRIRVSY